MLKRGTVLSECGNFGFVQITRLLETQKDDAVKIIAQSDAIAPLIYAVADG
jgi:hypothetical protein